MNDLLEALADPVRSSQALLALMMKGDEGIQMLAAFLSHSRPSSLPEARLLAVEGLSILKGPEALEALAIVACEHLDEIEDPIVRLAEQIVQSQAAAALGDFQLPRAREVLIEIMKKKPLIGAAEAITKSWDPRAIPYLITWLEDDFVAEAAGRALRRAGRPALAPLVDSLREKHFQGDREIGTSKRRRARILEILRELLYAHETYLIEDLLEDPDEGVRVNAAQAILEKGSADQWSRAFQSVLELLDSTKGAVRSLSEELLTAHLARGRTILETEIKRREDCGESAEKFFPHESALRILHRIRGKAKESDPFGVSNSQ